jgi:shikimate kinase
MNRYFYGNTISNFLTESTEQIIGILSINNLFYQQEKTQKDSWIEEIKILQSVLTNYKGHVYFEYTIPRMGQRIDVLLIIDSVVFVLEFKVGGKEFQNNAIDQVMDYALDLKNFHETSHNEYIAPILIVTKAKTCNSVISSTLQNDKLLLPIMSNTEVLGSVIKDVLSFCGGRNIEVEKWERGRYSPTPTIIEAAKSLYNNHSVLDISRSDASAINLSKTSQAISDIILYSKKNSIKSICFVTGVPGAGKTLVGLNIATQNIDESSDLHSVFLSGNGPLVAILREALTRDKQRREKELGKKISKRQIMSEVKMFIQNVHNFRDECLIDIEEPPKEHVALFDEAQRAWDSLQTSNFMMRKRNKSGFNLSEPEFLISCLDRHKDWAVIVCLVGGGQEINTGEAGICEWIESLDRKFNDWETYISPNLNDSEYNAESNIQKLASKRLVRYNEALHLSVSMRSFRAENVSLFVKQILDLSINEAKKTLQTIKINYPIVITREIGKAKSWLRKNARGSERFGMIVSSQAERLKPQSIFVKSPTNPIHWFLNGKDDVRSSYYLEDVATEFDVQGLELDWVCIAWDADFRYSSKGWEHWSFKGSRWNKIKKTHRQNYLKNAYRVLLTRARQGMVIVVPNGDKNDPTRHPSYYDPTYELLKSIGLPTID